MQSADFQPRDLAIARSLRQEIKKAGLFSPFMSTTLGWRSNSCAGPAAADVVAEPLGEAEDMTAVPAKVATAAPGLSMPAAFQAAGLVIPARMSAAVILPCCVISADPAAGWLSERLISSTGRVTAATSCGSVGNAGSGS